MILILINWLEVHEGARSVIRGGRYPVVNYFGARPRHKALPKLDDLLELVRREETITSGTPWPRFQAIGPAMKVPRLSTHNTRNYTERQNPIR